jgi:hypothetical protein
MLFAFSLSLIRSSYIHYPFLTSSKKHLCFFLKNRFKLLHFFNLTHMISYKFTFWSLCCVKPSKQGYIKIWGPLLIITLRCEFLCRNPSIGLATKAKGLQGCGPRGSPGVTSHTLGNVRKCEGVNP